MREIISICSVLKKCIRKEIMLFVNKALCLPHKGIPLICQTVSAKPFKTWLHATLSEHTKRTKRLTWRKREFQLNITLFGGSSSISEFDNVLAMFSENTINTGFFWHFQASGRSCTFLVIAELASIWQFLNAATFTFFNKIYLPEWQSLGPIVNRQD